MMKELHINSSDNMRVALTLISSILTEIETLISFDLDHNSSLDVLSNILAFKAKIELEVITLFHVRKQYISLFKSDNFACICTVRLDMLQSVLDSIDAIIYLIELDKISLTRIINILEDIKKYTTFIISLGTYKEYSKLFDLKDNASRFKKCNDNEMLLRQHIGYYEWLRANN